MSSVHNVKLQVVVILFYHAQFFAGTLPSSMVKTYILKLGFSKRACLAFGLTPPASTCILFLEPEGHLHPFKLRLKDRRGRRPL